MGSLLTTTTDLKHIENQISNLFKGVESNTGIQFPPKLEVHGSNLFKGWKEWKFLRTEPRLRNWLAFKVLEIALNSNSYFVFQGIDLSRINSNFQEPTPPHVLTHRFLMERIEEALESINSYALVINDNRSNQTEHALYRNNFQNLILKESRGESSKALNRLVDTLYFVDSKYSRGIQIADLVTYIHRRRVVGSALAKQKEEALENCWELISTKVLREKIWTP